MDIGDRTRHNVDLLERVLLDRNAEPTHVPLSILEHITNCFSEDQQIGSGGFAVVYKGKVGKGMVAVKKLSSTFKLPESKFHKEVECLMKAKHKNIVGFLGYCSETHGRIADNEGNFVMADTREWLLCFEYVPNGSLDKYITGASCGLEWRERYVMIMGICEGLLHLHENRILHLDLKPANILVDDHMIPKIADFDLSRCIDKEQTRAFTLNLCGSLGYSAPEFFRGQVAFASDIYSLGVTIVEIMTGEKGYPEHENVVDSWMNRLEGSDQLETQLEQVRVCITIGIECMDLDPKKRPVARHINTRLGKTASTSETGISSSAEQQVSFLKEQYCQEKTAKPSYVYLEKDLKEYAETEELMEYVRTPKEKLWQQFREFPGDRWSLCGVRDSQQRVLLHGESIFGSNSDVLYKLKKLFTKKAHRYYLNHGGPVLVNARCVKLYKKGELEPILKYQNLIGKDSFGEIYMGIVDGVLLTVRKHISGTMRENDQFANEVIIQSQLIHKSIIRLIGCCMEVEKPMLVYEFFSKGSLHEIIHSNNRVPLNLSVRLSIAAESAGAIAYMHSSLTTKIIHGDVNPSNILLDDYFVPKISYFGISKLIVSNHKHTHVVSMDSSIFYRDPVCLRTDQLTEKSDVYSFGVVMLELLTRKASYFDLVRDFLETYKQERKAATEMFDQEIVTTEDLELLDNLTEIAAECLNHDVDLRPKMVDVAKRLSVLNQSQRQVLS